MLSSAEIWHRIYDKGITGGLDAFSTIQKRLYYFIYFHIDFEMGGFLYNKHSDDPEENLLAPFIDSLRFFHYDRMADLLQRFHEASVRRLGDDDPGDTWEEFLSGHGLEELDQEINKEANHIIDIQWPAMDAWINQNREELQQEILE